MKMVKYCEDVTDGGGGVDDDNNLKTLISTFVYLIHIF